MADTIQQQPQLSKTTGKDALPAHLDPANYPQNHRGENINIELTYYPLDAAHCISHVRSPNAGANVLFLGTTRSSFDDRPVSRLSYTCYAPLAMRTLQAIARDAIDKHHLTAVSIAHRLGEVQVEEESIAIAVSAPHRRAAWRAGEEILEECKKRVEIWKREEFADGSVTEEGGVDGVWRANRDRDSDGNPVPQAV